MPKRTININQCSKEDLLSLPKMRELIAGRIISARPFTGQKDMIRKVKGFGETQMNAILKCYQVLFDQNSAKVNSKKKKKPITVKKCRPSNPVRESKDNDEGPLITEEETQSTHFGMITDIPVKGKAGTVIFVVKNTAQQMPVRLSDFGKKKPKLTAGDMVEFTIKKNKKNRFLPFKAVQIKQVRLMPLYCAVCLKSYPLKWPIVDLYTKPKKFIDWNSFAYDKALQEFLEKTLREDASKLDRKGRMNGADMGLDQDTYCDHRAGFDKIYCQHCGEDATKKFNPMIWKCPHCHKTVHGGLAMAKCIKIH